MQLKIEILFCMWFIIFLYDLCEELGHSQWFLFRLYSWQALRIKPYSLNLSFLSNSWVQGKSPTHSTMSPVQVLWNVLSNKTTNNTEQEKKCTKPITEYILCILVDTILHPTISFLWEFRNMIFRKTLIVFLEKNFILAVILLVIW